MRLHLGFLQHVYLVGDDFGFFVEVHHLTLDGDGVDFVKTSEKFAEVVEKFRGQPFGV